MTEAEIKAQIASLEKVIASGLKHNGEGGRQATFDEFEGLKQRHQWLKEMLAGRVQNPTTKAKFRRD